MTDLLDKLGSVNEVREDKCREGFVRYKSDHLSLFICNSISCKRLTISIAEFVVPAP